MIEKLAVFDFFASGHDLAAGHVLMRIAEPSAPHEKERGYFFAMAEVTGGTREYITKLQAAVDAIESDYYAEKNKGRDIFERILVRANETYAELLPRAGVGLHLAVGAIRPQGLTLAYYGAPLALAFYPTNHGLGLADIVTEKNQGDNLFSDIISGNLNRGDFFLIASPRVESVLPRGELGKILAAKAGRFGAAQIEKSLTGANDDGGFGGFIFSLADEGTPKTGPRPKDTTGSAASLEHLLASTKSTEETLSPPLLGDARSTLKNLLKEPTERIPHPIGGWRGLIANWGHGLGLVFRGIGHGVAIVFVGFGRVLRRLWSLTFGRTPTAGVAVRDWQRSPSRARQVWRMIPLSSKLLLCGAIILAGIFFTSLWYLRQNEAINAALERERNLVEAITNKKDAAEARLIYDDKTQARQLIREADALVLQLASTTPEQQTKVAQLSQALTDIKNRLDGVKVIAPDVWFDLNTATTGAKTTGLVRVGANLLAYGPDDNKLYSINVTTKQLNIVAHETVPGLRTATASTETNTATFLAADNVIAEYSTETGALTARSDAAAPAASPLIAAALYSRRLYTLDPTAGQIYKHSPTQTGYDRGAPWLKKTAIFPDARGLAVDGDVYVLTAAALQKFYTGEPQSFALNVSDPGLKDARVLALTKNNLFILDSGNRRVLVADKNGNVLNTYTNPGWQTPTGMAITDDGKNIFVLENNIIYQFKR